jgi:hypothetical protein
VEKKIPNKSTRKKYNGGHKVIEYFHLHRCRWQSIKEVQEPALEPGGKGSSGKL